MPKIEIPQGVKGKELYSFIRDNKPALIAEKKSLPIKFTDAVSFYPEFYGIKSGVATKTDIGKIPDDANKFRVKVVANAAWFLDSQFDVIIDDAPKNSIAQRKPLIKHIRDHEYKLAAEVGDVEDIYLQDINLTELGWDGKGKTQCLIFETDIRKDYDAITFEKYKTGKVKQHSIGLRYIKLEIAFKDEDDEKEMDFWDKYYSKIINKDVADQYGFFFVVMEYQLIENSAVLFGSNELTPTLTVSQSKSQESTIQQPDSSTVEQPQFNLDEAIGKFKLNF